MSSFCAKKKLPNLLKTVSFCPPAENLHFTTKNYSHDVYISMPLGGNI